VADLAGRAVRPRPQPAAEHQAAAHPGAGEHHQQVVEAAAGPEPVLGQGGDAHVVAHPDLRADGVGDQRAQRHRLAEPRQVGRPGDPAGRDVDQPGRADPDPGEPAGGDLGVLGGRLDHRGDLRHHRRRAAPGRGPAAGLAEPAAILVDDHALDLGAAEVDPYRVHAAMLSERRDPVNVGEGAMMPASSLRLTAKSAHRLTILACGVT
jgi:hypothetical protein